MGTVSSFFVEAQSRTVLKASLGSMLFCDGIYQGQTTEIWVGVDHIIETRLMT